MSQAVDLAVESITVRVEYSQSVRVLVSLPEPGYLQLPHGSVSGTTTLRELVSVCLAFYLEKRDVNNPDRFREVSPQAMAATTRNAATLPEVPSYHFWRNRDFLTHNQTISEIFSVQSGPFLELSLRRDDYIVSFRAVPDSTERFVLDPEEAVEVNLNFLLKKQKNQSNTLFLVTCWQLLDKNSNLGREVALCPGQTLFEQGVLPCPPGEKVIRRLIVSPRRDLWPLTSVLILLIVLVGVIVGSLLALSLGRL